MKRVVGLDVGDKRIGVAVSDGLGLTAQGLGVVQRRNIEKDVEAVRAYMAEYEASTVVVGLPRNMDGSLGPQAEKVRSFAEKLAAMLGVTVEYYDERLSTAMAQRVLIDADVSRARRKQVIDKLAAQVILQGYLDRGRRGG